MCARCSSCSPGWRSLDRPSRGVTGSGTLLGRIQADVRADRAPPGPPLPEADLRPALALADRSLEVHACHGRARQVEVVRDAILHATRGRSDPRAARRDRDVPGHRGFAPLIHATFGAGESRRGRGSTRDPPAQPLDLRVRLADRSLRQTNPVLGVVAALLDLADQRLTASQVLDLVDREPCAARFRLDDDDIARLQGWVAESGIRWGLDAAHRTPFGLDGWPPARGARACDRVLVGVTMTEDERRLFGACSRSMTSKRRDRPGRTLCRTRRSARYGSTRSASRSRSPPGRRRIAAAADALAATAERDAWQHVELQRQLDDAVAGHGGEPHAPSALHEVRALLAEHLRGPSDSRELPDGPPDDLHARADAVRCPTGSCACSGSMTASFRAGPRVTGTT